MKAIGSALLIGGFLILTTHIWVGNSHFAADGYNWVNDLRIPLNLSGWGMIFSGGALLWISVRRIMNAGKQSKVNDGQGVEIKLN